MTAQRVLARRERVAPAALAWLLLMPVLAVAVPVTLLLAPALGDVAFPRPGYHYWPEITVVRKPAIQAGYPLAVGWAIVYAVALLALARRGVSLAPRATRLAVAAVQLLAAGLVVACWIAQRQIVSGGTSRVYFTTATLLVAALLTALAAAAAMRWGGRGEPRAPRAGRAIAIVCAGVAILATFVWILPAVYSDSSLRAAPEALFLGAWFLDESSAVLDGRSPLVDMVAYGNLWPYLVAIPLRAFGDTYLAYTLTMTALTGVSLLALYATLLRVTRRAVFALVLYLPILAVSFFLEAGDLVARYSAGTYYGMFPLRYAGPCLLALLTAIHLGRAAPRRGFTIALLAAAGLVVLNNLDFGGAALLGTLGAVALTRRPLDRRALLRLGADAALGLVAALLAVSALTLIRAGELPHLGLLFRYGHIFVIGGNGNLPLPALGLHVVISMTFVACVAIAAVRVAAGAADAVLTGMLAWSGLFGLGAGAYYFTYRSHPDVLITLFPVWAFALALLVVVVRETAVVRGRLGLPALAVLFGFALVACSLAQVPSPWSQARRIAGRVPAGVPVYFPPDGFRGSGLRRVVEQETRPGERVLVLSPMGHRIAHEAGVVDVDPYPGLGQMPAREQLVEALGVLREEGGTRVFVSDRVPPGFDAYMRRLGYRGVAGWTGLNGWPVDFATEYRRAGAAPRQPTRR